MSHLAALLKSHQDINGVTLYDHLNQFLFDVLQSKQEMNTIELFSDFTKKNRFLFRRLPTDKEVNEQQAQQAEFAEWATRVANLLTTQRVVDMPSILQDFVGAARMLEFAGYGFGEEESYKIQLSIKKLAIETEATELVFYGKILCRGQDYYVARGVIPKQPTDDLGPNVEIRGDGCNFYNFWVTHDVLTDWNELPLVTPEQIRGARDIKYIFTGDLNATVKAYPPFPGKEKHMLKAQLVRISFANIIAPSGLYKPGEVNPKELEFEPEFKLPEFAELATIDKWVHVPPQILKYGRVIHWADPQLNEEQKATQAETDPEADRLKPIAEDRPLEPHYQTNWLVKIVGDQQVYAPKEDGSNNVYAVAILKNYTWPGSITVANQNGWANFYVGYGFKDTQAVFVPIMNNDLQLEPEDINEFPEPNPKNAPKPPAPVDPENPDGEQQPPVDEPEDQ